MNCNQSLINLISYGSVILRAKFKKLNTFLKYMGLPKYFIEKSSSNVNFLHDY